MIVLVADNPVVQRRLEAVARELGEVLLPFRSVAACTEPPSPRVVVVDVALPGALDAIGRWKADFGGVPVVGVLTTPRPELWTAAEEAGADLVVTHGTVHRRLPSFLEEFSSRTERRVRAGALKDFEGRLGFLGRLDDVALYRVGYDIYAAGDVCPHAGGRLSEGEIEGPVVTCPRHGSQFDVRTGERLRGPADEAISSYPVVVEDGAVFVCSERTGGSGESEASRRSK